MAEGVVSVLGGERTVLWQIMDMTGESEVTENVPVNLKTNLSNFERVSRDTGAEMEEGEEGGCTISGTGWRS